jgi:signal transduction histidine kinase
MIFKKLFFPIFILLGVLIFSSCSQEEKLKSKNKVYDILIEKALAFYSVQKYDSAFFYFYKSKDACKSDDLERITYSLYYIAEIQQKHCDFAESETTLTDILEINPQYKYASSIYNLLGLDYLEQYNFENAHRYFNLSIKATTNESEKMVCVNNIGYTFLESKKYNQAQKLLSNLVQNDALIANKLNYAKVLDNLGYAYFKLNNPQAINYYNKSLQIRDSINDDFELIASYIHLSEYYQISNTTLAKELALKAYHSATKINSPDDRILALKFLISSSDPTSIKSLALKQMSISDSIKKVREIAKNQFAKIKYDSKKAVAETQKYKHEKQLFLVLFIFVTLLSIGVYFLIKSKNKQKLLNETYNTETRISKRLHDELANDVFNAMTYAETQDLQRADKKETLVDNLDKIYLRTRNISKENSEIDTSDNYENTLKEMISSYINNDVNVIINKSNVIDWKKIKKESKITIYRILQELMVNMKKHSQCSLVVIGFDNLSGEIQINYSDNGIGCPEMLKLKKGLQNVENRILTIKGTITFETETNKGFKTKMTIPK